MRQQCFRLLGGGRGIWRLCESIDRQDSLSELLAEQPVVILQSAQAFLKDCELVILGLVAAIDSNEPFFGLSGFGFQAIDVGSRFRIGAILA